MVRVICAYVSLLGLFSCEFVMSITVIDKSFATIKSSYIKSNQEGNYGIKKYSVQVK